MPEELWAEAAALARRHGVHRVSRELRVGHEGLRRRSRGEDRGDGLRFIEVDLTALARGMGTSMAVVEVLRPDGSRLVMQVADGERLDFVALTEATLARWP